MKIGIIVYSQTGNTHSVAQKLADKLLGQGHEAHIERLKPLGAETPPKPPIHFELLPDLTVFDALIFASPVQAFSLAAAMKEYLSQIEPVNKKKVACFVTQHFKKPWMGGNGAISTMKKLCAAKGGIVTDTGVVNWSSPSREDMIADVVERLSRAF